MFAAKNLLQSRWTGIPISLTASSANNVTLTPANFTGYISGASCITYTVPTGVVIGSTTIASYALVFSGFNPNDRITINNSGKIVGKGGDGNSGAGGPALNVSGGGVFVINNKTGAIIGSGGGAGGSGVGQIACGCSCLIYGNAVGAGGGGGGGQGYGGGLGGAVSGGGPSNVAFGGGNGRGPGVSCGPATAGTAGSITSAGIGGYKTSGFAFHGAPNPAGYFGTADGGAGGTFGSSGSPGGSSQQSVPSIFGCRHSDTPAATAGGPAGYAIKGVGKYTLNNLGGNVYGPLIP